MKSLQKNTVKLKAVFVECYSVVKEYLPYIFSHHTIEHQDRCFRLKIVGKNVLFCSRCLGIYGGILAGLIFLLNITPLPMTYEVLILISFPVPTLMDVFF